MSEPKAVRIVEERHRTFLKEKKKEVGAPFVATVRRALDVLMEKETLYTKKVTTE